VANKDVSRIIFYLTSIVLVLGLVFGYGIAVGYFRIFPFSALKFVKGSFAQVFEEREMLLAQRPTDQLYPARYPGEGVTRYEEGRMAPGLTFVSLFLEDHHEMQLMRPDGSLVNRWPVSFKKVFPDASHIQPKALIPRTDWFSMIHGAHALPDGSVVFNFDYNGMVKLDRCGKVVWKLPVMSHHSLELAEDGGFWVPGRRYVENEPVFLPVVAPYLEDTLIKVSAEGEVVSETSVPALLVEDDLLRSIYLSDGQLDIGLKHFWLPDVSELVHLNDIEELSSEFADRFPQFEAGDLLVSLRNRHMIMVVDPVTHAVKWHQTGPWMRQHDPDFTARGTISVFNNNLDLTPAGTVFGGSNIMEIDPATRISEVIYGISPDQPLYSGSFGKHQVLETAAGENILITESEAGRVLEVDAEGKIVWEFINRFDDQDVARVTQATRYPDDYFNVNDWNCPD